MDPNAIQGNASDPRQVKRAGRIERERAEDEASDLRKVLNTPEGMRFVWLLLGDTGALTGSVYHDNPYRMAAVAGVLEHGRKLQARIERADPEALFRMMRLHRDRERREQEQADAVKPAELVAD